MKFFLWSVIAVCVCCFMLPGRLLAQDHQPPANATPTVDRLAAPPTVPSPTQADEGAQLFWLHCQPCHGDQGQGLTDEWREQYPEEEQYCWQSGCHSAYGKDLPEYGFVLPTSVPAVIGEGSLEKFANAHQLYAFIRAAMPYEAPGRLTDEEYLAITAFIARAHNAWNGTPLNEDNLVQLRLGPPADNELEEATTNESTLAAQSALSGPIFITFLGGAAIVFLLLGGSWLWRRRGQ